jgi:hypothetical protein
VSEYESQYKPPVLTQGPATKCVIDGKALGWLSCSACGMAMGINSATMGAKHPPYCEVRRLTGDTSGGLTLPQVANVAQGVYGVKVEVRVGSNVCSPAYAAGRLHSEHPFGLQGNTAALLNSPFRSTGTGVNHFVHVERGKGWHSSNGHWLPSHALVYDPAADGRHVGWGTAAEAWDWWPWSQVLEFAADLHPWGENDSRVLGPGRFYAGIIEPQFRAAHGGKRSTPYPDRTRARYDGVRVHSSPAIGATTTIDRLEEGQLFVAYQYATGPEYAGSTRWAGSRNGRAWVHASRLRSVGGAT